MELLNIMMWIFFIMFPRGFFKIFPRGISGAIPERIGRDFGKKSLWKYLE